MRKMKINIIKEFMFAISVSGLVIVFSRFLNLNAGLILTTLGFMFLISASINQVRNTSKEKKKNNKGYPYKKGGSKRSEKKK